MIKKFCQYGVGAIGATFFSLISIPFLTRIMSPAEYGKGMMYMVLIHLLFNMCSCGMSSSFIRFYFERESQEKKVALLYQCLSIVIVGFVIVLLLLSALYPLVFPVFFEESTLGLYVIVCLGLLVFGLNNFILLTFRMQQKALLYSFGTILIGLSYLVSIILIYYLYDYNNFKLIIFSQVIAQVVTCSFLLALNNGGWFHRGLSLSDLNIGAAREIYKYGWPFVFSAVLVWGFQSIDRVLLSQLSGFEQLGIYSAAFSLAAPIVLFQGVFSTLWAPIMNERLVSSPEESKVYFNKVYNHLLLLVPILILMLLSCKTFLVLLLGPGFSSAVNVFSWLLFMPLFYVLSHLSLAGILKSKKSKWNIAIAFFSLITNVFSCLILIPRFGALGASISLAVTYAVLYISRTVIGRYYYCFNIPIRKTIVVVLLLVGLMIADQAVSQYWSLLAL